MEGEVGLAAGVEVARQAARPCRVAPPRSGRGRRRWRARPPCAAAAGSMTRRASSERRARARDRRCRTRAARPAAAGRAGSRLSRSRTTMPSRGRASIRPLAARKRTASRSAVRLTPKRPHRSASFGSRSPGGQVALQDARAPRRRTTSRWTPGAQRQGRHASPARRICRSWIDHRHDQQRALGEQLVEGRHAGQDQAVVEHADDQHAEQRADDGALAALQRAAAQDRRGDRLQLQALAARGRLAGHGARGQQERRRGRRRRPDRM